MFLVFHSFSFTFRFFYLFLDLILHLPFFLKNINIERLAKSLNLFYSQGMMMMMSDVSLFHVSITSKISQQCRCYQQHQCERLLIENCPKNIIYIILLLFLLYHYYT